MKHRINLTKSLIESLESNPNKEYVDLVEPSLRVIKSQAKTTFIARVFWKRQRYYERLGTFPHLNISTARQIAAKFKLDVQLGSYECVRQSEQFSCFYQKRYIPHITKSIRSSSDYIDKLKNVFLPTLGSKRLAEITRNDINAILIARQKKVSPATVNRDLSAIASLFKFAIQEGQVHEHKNPIRQIRKLSEHNQNTKTLPNRAQIKRIIDYCTSRSEESFLASRFILLLMYTGCRRGELLQLKKVDVDLNEKTLTISKTKSGHPYQIPINDKAKQVINDLMAFTWNEYLFPTLNSSTQPMAPPRRFLVNLKADLSLYEFTFHHCRAVFATIVAYDNVFLAQKLLNHKDIKTTSRYLYADMESLATASQEAVSAFTG